MTMNHNIVKVRLTIDAMMYVLVVMKCVSILSGSCLSSQMLQNRVYSATKAVTGQIAMQKARNRVIPISSVMSSLVMCATIYFSFH